MISLDLYLELSFLILIIMNESLFEVIYCWQCKDAQMLTRLKQLGNVCTGHKIVSHDVLISKHYFLYLLNTSTSFILGLKTRWIVEKMVQ